VCGIAGIFNPDGLNVDHEIITRMSSVLIHRGPDEKGCHLDQFAHLASRRLSIIDLHKGTQPIYSEDKNLCITYNGEIYNYKKIRKDLKKIGYSFYTDTDTEVILYAFMEWQEECLWRFRGMFAFCIWDFNKKELFTARDRLGVKPLYYSILSDKTFLFASEIKALMQYPGIEKRIYPKSIDNLLTYGFNLAPYTFFQGIKQLLPGHYMRVSSKGIAEKEYWDIDLSAPIFNLTERELSQRLFFELEKSVKSRIAADVPVAAYLSGGIDSSAVAGIYSKYADKKIKTISIIFDQAGYDESEHSRKVARFFNTENIEFECRIKQEEVKDLIYYLEEPMATLLNLPLFLLSRQVKASGFKVALSGDGADEILGGYDYFKMLKIMQFIKKRENSFRKNILRKVYPEIKTFVQAEIQYLLLNSLPSRHPAMPY